MTLIENTNITLLMGCVWNFVDINVDTLRNIMIHFALTNISGLEDNKGRKNAHKQKYI